jgi:uncharacterized membrane protein YphA (DoxX/SURF4 family)
MNLKFSRYSKFDRDLTEIMARFGLKFLRISIGLIFAWFGFLKFFEGLSPAEGLAVKTIDTLTFGIFSEQVIIYGLATWETLIGLGLLFNVFLRETLILLYLQVLGTFTPVFLFPSEVFIRIPYAPTLEGQYIIKNLIIISAGIVLGATARGIKLKIDKKGKGKPID